MSSLTEEQYVTKVRQVLDELGSPNSSEDINASGDFWKHCRQVGLDPKVCAATIYTGERHRHEIARTIIKENASASESPVRDEWEVVVKRAGSIDSITSTAGRRPDEVTHGNVIFGGFNDDEKAAAFAKKMTGGGYISTFGPRREYTLHEEARAPKDIDEHALEELDLYAENTAELYPQKKSILRNLQNKITKGVYNSELAAKLWSYWVENAAKAYAVEFADPGMWKVIYPRSLRMELARRIEKREHAEMLLQMRPYATTQPVIVGEAAAEVAAECATCITWQKVTATTPNDGALAKKYGPIKTAKDVYRVIGDAMSKETQEVFLVIPLDLRGELKAQPFEVARGQYSRVTVGIENVMAAVYASGCEAFLCAHNHPSGKATPSVADKRLTESIREAVRPLGSGVTFVDHVVIGQKCAYSITEKKMYKCP